MDLKKWNLGIVAAAIVAGPVIVSAQTVTVLHSFNGADGQLPEAVLVQGSDGNFYGTTALGGANHKGTIFKIDSAGNLTTLHSFTGFPNDGADPVAGLIQGSDGNFYGTTALGGMFAQGTLFRVTPAGAVTIVHSFSGVFGDGSVPMSALVQASDGSFFGTTALGGTHSKGTVFRTVLGVVATLHSFGGSEGANPAGKLVRGSDGNFYGTTVVGGEHQFGTAFKIDSTGNLTTLHSFSGVSGEGADPFAGLVQGSDGNFYGTTAVGGTHHVGTLFKITPAGNLTTLYSLSGPPTEGATPFSALVQASDGNFYGTTALGGAHYFGTVFRLSTSTSAPGL